MAKKVYIGVNSVARNCPTLYIGVNNVARRIRSMYIGISGVARQCYKLYKWEKFNVTSTTTYEIVVSSTINTKSCTYKETFVLYKSCSVSSGTIVGNDSTSASADNISSLMSTYPYIKIDSNICKIYSCTTGKYPTLKYQTQSVTSTTTYSKGTTSYGYLYSLTSSTYPDNGKSGSYWYVKLY